MPSTSKKKQNEIRRYAANIARHRYELDTIPSLKQLEDKFDVARGALTRYLKEGIRDAFGRKKQTRFIAKYGNQNSSPNIRK